MYIEQRLDIVENIVAEHDLKLDKIANGLATLTLVVNQGFAEVRRDIRALESRMDRVEARLDRLEERMDRLEERMDRLEARMDRIEERMDVLETKMDFVIDQLGLILKKLN